MSSERVVEMEMSFAIVIASKGRPEILSETVESLKHQSVPIRHVFLAVPSANDVESSCSERSEVTVIHCPPGTTRQRNVALDQTVEQFEIIVFLDDDMQLQRDYVAAALQFLRDQPAVVAFSGLLLRNGGVSRTEAKSIVDSHRSDVHDYRPLFRSRGRHWILHGCNMVVRSSVLRFERFDENLPLYGFAEDYDISLRVRSYGLVGRFRGCVAVHLEAASGRVSEKRLGYSTLANNWYFLGKRITHCPSLLLGYIRFLLRLAVLEPMRNAGLALLGKRGRAERLHGNVLALRDILCGVCSPGNVNDLE